MRSNIGIVESCRDCPRVKWDQICSTYLEPEIWWRGGNRGCPFHPDVIARIAAAKGKEKRLNPLKASKKSMGK